MGCWNHTCMISQMHILSDDDVVEVWLAKGIPYKGEDGGNYTYSTAVWAPFPILLYGKYNDYGATEHYEEGPRHDLLLELIKDEIIERDMGENQYHDHEVRKEGLTFERLHTIDHGGRGLVRGYNGKDRSLKHAVINRRLFDKIMNEFYLESAEWTNRETYEGYYVKKTYLKDISVDLLEGVKWVRAYIAKDEHSKYRAHDLQSMFWKVEDAPAFVKHMGARGSDGPHSMPAYFGFEYEHLTDEELVVHIEEHLKFQWLFYFVDLSRKMWSPQVGQGSQSQENHPYELLSEFYIEDIKAQKERWGDEE